MSTNCSDPANGVSNGDLAFVCNPDAAVRQCFPYTEVYGTGPDCKIGQCDNFADEGYTENFWKLRLYAISVLECQDGYIKCDKCKCVLDKSACWENYGS